MKGRRVKRVSKREVEEGEEGRDNNYRGRSCSTCAGQPTAPTYCRSPGCCCCCCCCCCCWSCRPPMPWAMKLRKAAMKASGSTFTGGCPALEPDPAAAAAAAAVDAQPPSAAAVPGAGRLRMGEGVLSGSLPLVPMHVNTFSSSNLNCGQSKPWGWGKGGVERKEWGQNSVPVVRLWPDQQTPCSCSE